MEQVWNLCTITNGFGFTPVCQYTETFVGQFVRESLKTGLYLPTLPSSPVFQLRVLKFFVIKTG